MSNRHISEAGIEAIIRREGLVLTAYRCEAGRWTIGIGHTGKMRLKPGRPVTIKAGVTITHEEVRDLFFQDMVPIEDVLNDLKYDFTQHQFDALCSFIFNIGVLKFASSTIKRLIQKKADPETIAKEFPRWVYITSPSGERKISPGLKNRRESERTQFLTADDVK